MKNEIVDKRFDALGNRVRKLSHNDYLPIIEKWFQDNKWKVYDRETVIKIYMCGNESEIVFLFDRYRDENNKRLPPAKQLTFDDPMPKLYNDNGGFDKKELIKDQKPEQQARGKKKKSSGKKRLSKDDNSRTANHKQKNSKGGDEAVIARIDYISEDPAKILNGEKK